MEDRLKSVEEFSLLMREKGYQGFFHTNSGYPGKIKESLLSYLAASEKGYENGFKEGVSLSGYLKWDGEERSSIRAYMRLDYRQNKIQVHSMNVVLSDPHGKTIRNIQFDRLTTHSIPTAAKAIESLANLEKPSQKKRFRIKF